MHFASIVFLFLNIWVCISSFAKGEARTLTWIRWNDPPIFIFEAPFKGQGVLDVVERELIAALPQYRHKHLEANVPRVLKEAEEKSPICNAGWLDTPEWAKLFYFSKPVFLIPANGVLLKQSKLREVKGLKSLQDFLDKKSHWLLGVGRLYGEGIDEVLFKNDYKKNKKILPVASSLLVHRMLNTNRVQYTLGYPFEAKYYDELFGNTKDRVVHVPLSDNKPFVEVVVACPKTEWGKQVIKDVNKALTNLSLLKRLEKGVARWHSQEDQKRLEPELVKFYQRNYPGL
ncbi:TIGR02285 family protein [Bdellovibrio reynosensis]|uniref:TIGR02285 family protein n=1 Tax=Bdellovibrio reynosensis TaxID=2835041 RepID=A0ABY4C4E9_9BACT|nr:TIGR02285 family protein [Bdellovibrio reynosensis]UOE99811.1 TIGR02285 family protein [Bdellovibrio reynosensis]